MVGTIIVIAVSCGVSVLATMGAMMLGWRLGVVDRPSPDKVHDRTVPRTGGLGIACGFMAGVVVLVCRHALQPETIAIIAGAAIVVIVGLLDDIFHIRPLVKLVGISVAAGVPLVFGVGPDSIVGAAAAWVFVVFLSNATNLLDGLDGLAGGVALIAASAFFAIFTMLRLSAHAMISISLAGAVLGFLFYNLPPARTFMGDSGSLLLGYMLAWQALVLADKLPGGIFAAVLIVAVPITDTLFVTLRRAFRRQNILAGGLDHTYNLLAGGIGRSATVLSFCCAACLLGAAAIAFLQI